jgi:VanZ family protein
MAQEQSRGEEGRACGTRNRNIVRWLWSAGVLAVVVGSLLPGDSLLIQELALLDVSDKVQHFCSYAALAFLPALYERRRAAILLGLGLIALGISLEFGQLMSVDRDFEVGDMVADSAGVSIGLAAGWIVHTRFGLAKSSAKGAPFRDK